MNSSPNFCTIVGLVLAIAIGTTRLRADIEQTEFRTPPNDTELLYWLANMRNLHQFTTAEMMVATGLTQEEVETALKHLPPQPAPPKPGTVRIAPYPGGRHPRTGFRDGAIRPQRETKVSIFPPWPDGGYVVLDAPEAIWCQQGLLYLAHTHVPTIWEKQKIALPQLEWTRSTDASLRSGRNFPNGVRLETDVLPADDHVLVRLQLHNGSQETLSDLRVQMCAMLANLKGFAAQTNDNKVFDPPYAACRSEDGSRWVILAADPIHRAWGNPPCPCLHADPKFPDCKTENNVSVRARLSFYQGDDIQTELRRIENTKWRTPQNP